MGCHVYSTKGARVLIHSTSPMALEHTSQWVDDQRVHYPLYKYSCLDWGWSWYPWTRSSQMYQQLVWFSQKWGHLPILGGYTEESHDAATREPIPLVSSRGVFFFNDNFAKKPPLSSGILPLKHGKLMAWTFPLRFPWMTPKCQAILPKQARRPRGAVVFIWGFWVW